MTRRDRELLDKQFRWQQQRPRNSGSVILVTVLVFLAGMTFGSAVFAHQSDIAPIPLSTAAPAGS